MDKTKREDLEKAYRKEKDSRVVPKMLVVHMVRVRKMSVGGTAANLMRSERWVHKWLKRFDAGGLDDFRDLSITITNGFKCYDTASDMLLCPVPHPAGKPQVEPLPVGRYQSMSNSPS